MYVCMCVHMHVWSEESRQSSRDLSLILNNYVNALLYLLFSYISQNISMKKPKFETKKTITVAQAFGSDVSNEHCTVWVPDYMNTVMGTRLY